MSGMGALGIGLSIVFGGFVLVLLAEIYYVLFWKKYESRIGTERGDFAHEAALVGSFGGYSENSQFLAKLFPETTCNDNLYMHGGFLFTIEEETKEDMESVKHKDEGAASATHPLHFPSSKLSSESPSPKQKLQQLSNFPYSIGLIQQPQFFRSMSAKSISHQGLVAPMQQNIPSEKPHFSCSLPSSPVHHSSSASLTPESVSPSICSRATSPEHQAFSSSWTGSPEQVFSHSVCISPEIHCVSNPMYEVDTNNFQCIESYPSCSNGNSEEMETPFGTPVSSPSLLTPPGTPPLTPINTSGVFFKTKASETSSFFSSSESDPSFSCSFHKKPSGRHPQGPPSAQATLMARRAFVSLETLPRESPCLPPISRFCRTTATPGSNSSSNASSPCTPFSTAPSTPYFTSSIHCPLTTPHKSASQSLVEESFCMV